MILHVDQNLLPKPEQLGQSDLLPVRSRKLEAVDSQSHLVYPSHLQKSGRILPWAKSLSCTVTKTPLEQNHSIHTAVSVLNACKFTETKTMNAKASLGKVRNGLLDVRRGRKRGQ